MSRAAKLGELALPWSGMAAAALGAGLAHQIGSDGIFSDCPGSSPLVVFAACLVGVLIVGAGAFGSWIAWRRTAAEPPLRMIAGVSLMLCGLALFAIILPTIAAVVIPTCFG